MCGCCNSWYGRVGLSECLSLLQGLQVKHVACLLFKTALIFLSISLHAMVLVTIFYGLKHPVVYCCPTYKSPAIQQESLRMAHPCPHFSGRVCKRLFKARCGRPQDLEPCASSPQSSSLDILSPSMRCAVQAVEIGAGWLRRVKMVCRPARWRTSVSRILSCHRRWKQLRRFS